jgi:fructose-bisphosphate aldolase/2-amino-3,7-dideoxy-D-threo-hept-6-ulosonate synthase
MFAISHGTSASTVIPGIENIRKMVRHALNGGADVVFLSRGYICQLADEFRKIRDASIAMKVSSSAARAAARNQEVQIASPAEALRLGADAIVALVPLAPENEAQVLSWVAKLGEECNQYGIPFIAEAEYPSSYEPGASKINFGEHLEYLRRSARLCAELGADIIKTNWTGSAESFRKITEAVTGFPVVVAGGSRESDEDLLSKIEAALDAGAIGCSVGRNIFQHPDPEAMSRAISNVVRRKASAKEAAAELTEKLKEKKG